MSHGPYDNFDDKDPDETAEQIKQRIKNEGKVLGYSDDKYPQPDNN